MLDLVKAVIFLGCFLITIIFAIPATILGELVKLIIPPIITFVAMTYLAIKRNNNSAIFYNIIIHLLLIFTCIAVQSNPGTDDSFSTLDQVVNSVVYSSIFTFIAFIFFIVYLISVFKSKTNSNTITETKPISQSQVKYCLHCGSSNEKSNNFCSKCGMRL